MTPLVEPISESKSRSQPIERLRDLIVVRLPTEVCLYSQRAAPFLESLEHIAEDIHRFNLDVSGVLVIQKRDASDIHETWVKELNEDTLFSSLVDTIDSFRWILSLIRNSPIPWVFMSAHHCLGSFWDLALACQRRYFFEPDALVGFPEIAGGSFPPGGNLESLNRNNSKTREFWESRPVRTAIETLADGLIHFCSKATNWEAGAIPVFRELISLEPLAGVRQSPKRRRKRQATKDQAFDLSASLSQRQAALEELQKVWKIENSQGRRLPVAWDYCWQLIKERPRIQDPLAFGRLMAHIVARHYLTPTFLSTMSHQLLNSEDLAFVHPPSSHIKETITVDLDEMVPPTDILLRLMKNAAPVVFTASQSKTLAEGLNLIYGRLERSMGAIQTRHYWNLWVSWYLHDERPWGHPILRWRADDRFEIILNDQISSFRRLENNLSNAKAGVLEWEGAELPQDFIPVLPLVSEGAIRVAVRSQALPTSILLRSVFLDEMIRISRHCDNELQGVCEALKRHGWGFAGDVDAWDRFLKTRFEHISTKITADSPTVLPIPKMSWDLGTWKHARAGAMRKAGELASKKWNQTAISQHLAVFLGLVTHFLIQSEPLLSPETTDHLAALALGFSKKYGTPLTYLKRRGMRRVHAYMRLAWPHLARLADKQWIQER